MPRTSWLPGPVRRAILALGCTAALVPLPPRPALSSVATGTGRIAAAAQGTAGQGPCGGSDLLAQQAEHLARLEVGAWHRAGYRGQGIKVAILDLGFRGYRTFLGQALPGHVAVHSCRRDGNLEARSSQHGILCAEVVHVLAPDAELLFVNWEAERPDQFLDAVRWARQQEARILSCSLIMPSWSDGEGGGPVHAALAGLLGSGDRPGDMLGFASAGNTAQRHWSGVFHGGRDRFHEWQPGQRDNRLTPWGGEQVSVELCWRSGANYDLSVRDCTTGREAARSLARDREARRCAVARFQPEPFHSYQVRVRLVRGPAGAFHLVVLGGDLEHTTARGSIPFPADGPALVAVGAVAADGRRLAYSSCGPNSPQPKPDLMAPVPFPCLFPARLFSGTSAAAPQAAALAALWWGRHPDWTAGQVRQALRASARDLGPPGHDFETGYGVIRLP